MTVLARFVRDRRRATVWWLLAVAGLVTFTAAFYPSLEGNQAADDVVKDLPESVRRLFGLEEGVSISSAPGYLNARLYSSLLPIALLIFGVTLGTQAIGGDEEDGALELLLSTPLARLRLSFERYIAVTALLGALSLGTALTVVLTGFVVGLFDGVSSTGFIGVSVAVFLLALLHASVAFAIGAATGRKDAAYTSAAAIAVSGYMLYGVAQSSSFEQLGWISPWHWYLDRNMLVHGLSLWPLVLPLVCIPPIVMVGVKIFLGRDLH
jgi:beta-exotoxin I transport system permease protein